MKANENPITILQQKYDAQEITDIVEITLQEMKTIGFVTFYFKVKYLIKPYLFWSSLVSLIFIMFGNADLWTFFVPALPVVLLLILFVIDFVRIQFGLLRAQKRLQKFIEKEITWDDMVLSSVIAFAIREPMEEEDDDELTPPY
jgi:hypothetical protein